MIGPLHAPTVGATVVEALYFQPPTGEIGRELERAATLAQSVTGRDLARALDLRCRVCGAPITKPLWLSSLERGRGRYCSPSCQGRAGGRVAPGKGRGSCPGLRAYHKGEGER